MNYVCFIIAQCRDLQLEFANDSNPVLMYSDSNRIEGTTVSFICPSGLVLNGTIPVTCTSNGEWEPDPQDVKCIEG